MTATNFPHAPAAGMSGSRRPPASVLHTFVSVLSVQMVMRRYVADTSCAADVPRERPDLLHWCKWLSNAPCAHLAKAWTISDSAPTELSQSSGGELSVVAAVPAVAAHQGAASQAALGRGHHQRGHERSA